MHPTKNDLQSNTRKSMVDLLNARLADAVDLSMQAKQAHWNVKGPGFIALHELFDQVHDHLRGHVDEIAERVTALGGRADGTVQVAAKASTLPAYPMDAVSGKAHCEALSVGLAEFGKSVRSAIDQASELGDEASADLFTGMARDLDKDLWFVEAHLQADS